MAQTRLEHSPGYRLAWSTLDYSVARLYCELDSSTVDYSTDGFTVEWTSVLQTRVH